MLTLNFLYIYVIYIYNMDIVTLTSDITSCNATTAATFTINVAPYLISLSSGLFTGTQTSAAQTWTLELGDTISSVADFNIDPIESYTFPLAMFVNSTDCTGYVTITTAGVISFKVPVVPVVGNAGWYPFCIQYAYN
jgi:hypothetical protein